jgi:hypothetical protein
MLVLVVLRFLTWDEVVERLREMLAGAGEGTLTLLLAILVALLAWGIARIVAGLARIVLRAARFNDGMRRLFGESVAPPRHEPAALVSWGLYWIVIVTGVILAIDTLGFDLSGSVGARLRDVLPRVIAAMVLLAFGGLLAMLLGAVTRRFFDSAGIKGGRLRGQVVAVVLTAFAMLLALEQLGLAAQFIMAMGLAAVAGVALALGLAFGLGCRDLARDFVVEYLRSLDEEGPKRPA